MKEKLIKRTYEKVKIKLNHLVVYYRTKDESEIDNQQEVVQVDKVSSRQFFIIWMN